MRKFMAIPHLGRQMPPDIYDALVAIKENLERLKGEQGDDRLVTQASLNKLVSQGLGNGGITGGTTTPGGNGGYDPSLDSTAPPLPAGLQASGAIKTIIVQWDDAGYLNHAYTEIVRNTANTFDGNEQVIGTSDGSVFSDVTGSQGQAYFYWIRFRTEFAGSAIYSAYAGPNQAGLATIDGSGLSPELFSGNKVSNPDAEGGTAVDWIMDGATGAISADNNDSKSGEYSFNLLGAPETRCVCRAFAIEQGKTYRVGISVRGVNGAAAGLYIRINYKNSTPSDGRYVTASETVANADIVNNQAITLGWTDYSGTFTAPAGAKFASVSVYNWTGGDVAGLLFDNVEFIGQLVTEHLGANIITAGSGIIGNLAVDTAAIADAAITIAKIADLSVTNAKISGVLFSNNYVSGSIGWLINKNGQAEFNDAVIRGTLTGATGTFSGSLTASAVNAINTINLAGDAVTVGTSSFTSSANVNPSLVNVFGSWLTVATVSMDLGTSGANVKSITINSSQFDMTINDGVGSWSIDTGYFSIRAVVGGIISNEIPGASVYGVTHVFDPVNSNYFLGGSSVFRYVQLSGISTAFVRPVHAGVFKLDTSALLGAQTISLQLIFRGGGNSGPQAGLTATNITLVADGSKR